jgi:hypothetical protein
MRSNNFFDQFNSEIDDVAKAAQKGLAFARIATILAVGVACFWLFH